MVANSVQRLINKPISNKPADLPPKLVEKGRPPPPPLRPTRPSPQPPPPPPTHKTPRSPPVLAGNEDKNKDQMRTPPPPCYSRAAPPIPNNEPQQLQRKFLTPPPPKSGTLCSPFRMSTHSLPDYGLPGREHPTMAPVVPVRKDSLRKIHHIGAASEEAPGNTFEEHFQRRFKHSSLFPAPEVYSNCEKTFPSNRTTGTQGSKQASGYSKQAATVTQNRGKENLIITSPIQGPIILPQPPPLPRSASSPRQPSQTAIPVPQSLPKATTSTPPRLFKTSSTTSSTSLPLPGDVLPAPPPVSYIPIVTAPTLPSYPMSILPTVPVPPPLPKLESTQLSSKVPCPPPQQVEDNNENNLKAFLAEPVDNPTSNSVTNTNNTTVEYQEKGVAVMEEVRDDKTREMCTTDDSPVSVKDMVEKLSKLYSKNYQGESNAAAASKACKPAVPSTQPVKLSRIAGLQCQKPPSPRLRSTSVTRSSPSPPPPAPPRVTSFDPILHSPSPSTLPNSNASSPTVSTPVARRQSFRAAPPPPCNLHEDGSHGERLSASREVPGIRYQVRRKYSVRAAPPPPVMDKYVKSGTQVVENAALSSKLQMC